MAKSLNKRELAAEQRKLDNRKTKLLELTGENSVLAFDRVRLVHDQNGVSWVEAYDAVIAEVEAQQAADSAEGEG